MPTQKQREEFCAVLAKEFPTPRAIDVARLLMRHAVTHGRIQETWCSVELNDKATKRLEAKEKHIEALIARHAATLGCPVRFDGDPRGYTVKLFLPSKRYNTFGGAESGYGVPQ